MGDLDQALSVLEVQVERSKVTEGMGTDEDPGKKRRRREARANLISVLGGREELNAEQNERFVKVID